MSAKYLSASSLPAVSGSAHLACQLPSVQNYYTYHNLHENYNTFAGKLLHMPVICMKILGLPAASTQVENCPECPTFCHRLTVTLRGVDFWDGLPSGLA